MRRAMGCGLAGAAALALLVGSLAVEGRPFAPECAAQEEPRKSVDADAVYFGNAREWSKPAEVDVDAVYAQIDEYKRIVEEKIEPTDTKYGVLMSKARKRFVAAVRSAAKDGGYDLVARVGSVSGVDSVPVITQEVIGKL